MSARINSVAPLIPAIALAVISVRCANTPPHEDTAPDDVRHLSLVFGGDVMQHIPQVTAAMQADGSYDYDETFRYLRPIFDTTDIVILNFETTVSATGRYSGYPMFASPAALASSLRDCGVDAVVLANNHIADKGYGGVKATTDALYEAGVRYTGAFANEAAHDKMHPLIFDKNGFRIALLNYTYGLNGMPEPRGAVVNRIDTLSVRRDIESARHKGVDYVIVFFHWGEEYSSTPNSVQRSLARISRSAGADFVIGSHPHVVQPLEIEHDSAGNVIGAVAYSLGNLVSNQRERRTDGGMLLGIDIAERDSVRTISVSHIPTWVYMPNIHGRKRYLILPRPVADTMLSRDPAAHTAYKIFLEDSRRVVTGE